MLQQVETPGDILPRPIVDTRAMEESDEGISIVDRVALAAAFSVAILILAMAELTCKSATQSMPAAALVAMSPYIDLPCPNWTAAGRTSRQRINHATFQ